MIAKNNKRFVFFIGSLEEGGAERVLTNIAEYTAASLPVTVLLYHDREVFYKLGEKVEIKTVTKETKSNNPLKNIIWIRKYLKENALIFVSFLTVFNIIAILSCLGTGIPLIVSERSDPYRAPESRVIRIARNILYNFVDLMVVQTNKSKAYFNKKIQKKTVIIKNPVDVDVFKGKGTTSKKNHSIITVGRLMPVKNQMMIIRAFSQIMDKIEPYTLDIYGDGPLQTRLQEYISDNNLDGRVFLRGSKKDIFPVYASADLFVLSSNYEGMPNALIEAMCIGVPVISTKVSGACELIRDGFNGRLIEVGDAEALADGMLDAIINYDKSLSMAQNALTLNDELSLENIMKQWQDCINKVLDKKHLKQ